MAIILFHPMAGRTTEIVMEVSNSALYKLARLAGRSTNGKVVAEVLVVSVSLHLSKYVIPLSFSPGFQQTVVLGRI